MQIKRHLRSIDKNQNTTQLMKGVLTMKIQEQMRLGRQVAKQVELEIHSKVTFTWTHNGIEPIFVFNIEGNTNEDMMCNISLRALTQLIDPSSRVRWWFEQRGGTIKGEQTPLTSLIKN